MRLLIVDDEENMRKTLRAVLRKEGHDVLLADCATEALRLLASEPVDVVLTDIKMPGMSGLELLKSILQLKPGLPVLLMTAYGTIENAVQAMRDGAYDFVTKPFNMEEMRLKLAKISEHLQLRQKSEALEKENTFLREEVRSLAGSDEIIGNDPQMKEIDSIISMVASHKTTVLIRGESGVGKELVARAIHYRGSRANRPFIRVNCAALASGVLESELFGHEKGAFTGAIRQKAGRIEMAHTGTLFLDEIGDITLEVQTKLLRVLQEREFERVGGEKPLQVDVRIITATNRDLEKAIKEGQFREDLYYRLNVIQIVVPPLRKRPADILLLAGHFLTEFSRQTGKGFRGINDAAMTALSQYHWPGNVRELQNIIERAVVLEQGEWITPASLPVFVRQEVSEPIQATNQPALSLLDSNEKALILQVLQETGGQREEAAQRLGMGRTTLWRKMKRYGIEE